MSERSGACRWLPGRARRCVFCFFFFNDTATTEIYTLSLHDALPICLLLEFREDRRDAKPDCKEPVERRNVRSEEHTSELQSQSNLVCRLLLEKKKPNCPSPSRSSPSRERRPATTETCCHGP